MMSLMMHLFVAGVLTTGSRSTAEEHDNGKIPLYISFISSINAGAGFSNAGIIPAFDMALEIVNNRSDILPRYLLQRTDILDSKCHRTAALDSFFEHFSEDNRTYISTVCCGCSVATIPVAEISHYWNIPQMSNSIAVELNDRIRFRSFFRTLPTNRNLALGVFRTAKQFGWRKMLIITQKENLFAELRSSLQTLFTQQKWLIDTSILIESTASPFPTDSVFNKILSEHYRIILINTYSKFAYTVLCQAFMLGLVAPQYIWITPLWYNSDWWKGEEGQCSSENLQQVLNGSIGVIPDGFVISESTLPTSSGLTTDEFSDEYRKRFIQFQMENPSVVPVSLPNVGFDMGWSLALGLDTAATRISQNNDSGCENGSGEIVPLEQFDYSNQKMGCILRESMESVEFQGFSGLIKFNENGSQSDNLLLIQQYRYTNNGNKMKRIMAAKIDIIEDSFLFTNGTQQLWEGIPYDGYPENAIDQYHIALIIIYDMISVAGLIFAFVCLIFNIVFQKKRVVKLSSSKLNFLIILGSVALYFSVFTYMYMPSDIGKVTLATVVCNLRIWLFSLGYTLCFAVILSKTWRVYHIFTSPSPNKKIIKDWKLLVIISAIVLGDLAILIVGTAVQYSRLKAEQIRSTENPTTVKDNVVYENYAYVCLRQGTGQTILLSVSFVYKGLLQIVGIFIAFHARKVKMKALNDSKETTAIIYVNTIILITLAASAFTLDSYHNGYAAIFGMALLVDASLFLGVLFVPKMITLYNDPMEKKAICVEQNVSQNTLRTLQTNDDKSEQNSQQRNENKL